ncbi:transketolase [Pseudomonadota bacterium]|nr:transketolase [Pseudomonadota bacterium]
MENHKLANAIRFLSIDAVQAAKSGHPGMPMGMADIAVSLWKNNLKHNPSNPKWVDRDRFVLSNGHGSMLLYSLLHLTGYDLNINDLKDFRKLKSKTPGHPEYDIDIGVETTTGPLGQGIGNAVGMALAEKNLAATFNKEDIKIIDHFTYAFLGDGCLMEGISHEVCSFAGTHKLGKLICFYDQNGISIDGEIDLWFTDNTKQRFESYGWHVVEIDGHDIDEINKATEEAKKETERPSMICCKTTIGFGSPNKSGTAGVHGSPLGDDEIEITRKELNWEHAPFEIPEDIYDAWNAKDEGAKKEKAWEDLLEIYKQKYPEESNELERRFNSEMTHEFNERFDDFLRDCLIQEDPIATRKASQICLDHFCANLPELIGGSADLTGSNNTFSKHNTELTPDNPSGSHIYYGVREFGMVTIMNGMSLHGGIRPYGGTFLVFMDYARNAVRLSAMMSLPNIYVFTHDSIGLGEDGPTHQPIEHLVTLRATPNLYNWRPADLKETAVAWKESILSKSPSCLILSRQGLPQVKMSEDKISNISKGGYLVQKDEDAELNIISSGSELQLAIQAAKDLDQSGIKVNVVSMPCLDRFLEADLEYQNKVIQKDLPSIVVEAAHPNSWYRILGRDDLVIGMTTFGESAPAKMLFEEFGFTAENIVSKAKKLLNK